MIFFVCSPCIDWIYLGGIRVYPNVLLVEVSLVWLEAPEFWKVSYLVDCKRSTNRHST